jgi:hypothetical protein
VEKQGWLRTAEADTLDDLADTTPIGVRPSQHPGCRAMARRRGQERGGEGI